MIDTYFCGHDKTPENTVMNGRNHGGCCAICKKARNKAYYHSVAREIRQLERRMRRLPVLLTKARKYVTMLESEARRYGMDELFREDVV